MKMQGKERGRSVLVFIDTEASHNFISSGLVQLLDLPVESTPPYGFRLGDEYKKQT